MEPTEQQYVVVAFYNRPLTFDSESTSQDAEQSPNSMINRLPHELLLVIFDSYRQITDATDACLWKDNHGWFNLSHVCRKWRAVMFASSSRLQLGISVKPYNLGDIDLKMVLSDPLPIIINFMNTYRDISGSNLQRMRTALERHRGRVRGIAFRGESVQFDKYFERFSEVTESTFPMLESLDMNFRYCDAPKLVDTFLGGSDPSNSHLRRLKLRGVSFASIYGVLSSSTSLTDLYLLTDFILSPSSERLLVACLQAMSCLRCLTLFLPPRRDPPKSSSQPPTPKDVVVLSKLTRFLYSGPSVSLNALTAGLSAPSLRHFNVQFPDAIWPPIVHLPRFIDEIGSHYHTIHVTLLNGDFYLRFFDQPASELIDPCLELESHPKDFPESIIRMSSVVSARLSVAENLLISFDETATEEYVPWRWFLQRFPSVKTLQTMSPNNDSIALYLLQGHEEHDDNLVFLPALEEIELCKYPEANYDSSYEAHIKSQLAAFEPFVSARQQAGRPVNVVLGPCAIAHQELCNLFFNDLKSTETQKLGNLETYI